MTSCSPPPSHPRARPRPDHPAQHRARGTTDVEEPDRPATPARAPTGTIPPTINTSPENAHRRIEAELDLMRDYRHAIGRRTMFVNLATVCQMLAVVALTASVITSLLHLLW